MTNLKKCYNIADLRKKARAKLPAPIFDYIDGGADDEWTLRRNTTAFEDYQLMPRQLCDINHTDMSSTYLGCELKLPFFLAPTGMSRLFHHEKELAACRAAATHGTIYSLSTLATTSLEEIAALTKAPKMFQVYILRDRELTREFVARCRESDYQALCLTVDTALAGNRERDLRNGMTMPPEVNLSSFFSYCSSVNWLFHLLLEPEFKLANVAHRVDALGKGSMGLIDYVNSQFDRTVTWNDVEWLIQQWKGPFVIKGLLSISDVERARDIGASAVMLSNHGGRQLDGTPAPVDCIAPIRDAVGPDIELIVDGGIRRGTHIVKALALGADACSIGRPYLYGLAAGGEQGVDRSLEILASELERSMALLGCSSIQELGREHLRHIQELQAQT